MNDKVAAAIRQWREEGIGINDVVETAKALKAVESNQPNQTPVTKWVVEEDTVFVRGLGEDWYDVRIPSIRQQEVRFNRTIKEWVVHPSGQYTGHVFFDTREDAEAALRKRFASMDAVLEKMADDLTNAPKLLDDIVKEHTQDVQRLRRVKGLLYTYMTDAAPGWLEKIKELRK